MASAAFDTLQAAREIEQAGLERAQAEAIAQAIQRRSADYATKTDVEVIVGRAKNAVLLAILAATSLIIASVGVFA